MFFEILSLVLALCVLGSWKIHDVLTNRLKLKYTKDIAEARKDAIKRSRSTIEGETFERLVTHFKEWKFGSPSDARFIASPLDYVVFSGLSTDTCDEVIFVEIKTGDSQTTKRQRSVRDAIVNGKVRYELLEIKDK